MATRMSGVTGFGLFVLLAVWPGLGWSGVTPVAVTFDRPVYFVDAGGNPLAVEAGTYVVERIGNRLQLTSSTGSPIEIQAEPVAFDMPVQEPAVFSVMRNTDDHLLIHVVPEEPVMAASGTYSGVRSRDVASRTRLYAAQQIRPNVTQFPEGTLLPGGPRIKSVSYSSFAQGGALVPFANVNLTITLTNFTQAIGTRVQYRIVAPATITGQDACTLTRNPRILIPDAFQIDPSREGRITIPGWFSSAGACTVGIELLFGKGEPARLVAGPFPVEALQRYRLNQTWNLRNTLAFQISGASGTCEGTSVGPTNHAVGVIESGGDLALRIRSGPLGTECQFTSRTWVLPEGVRLVSTTWERIRELPEGQTQPRCCAVDAYQNHCLTPAPTSSSFRFDRGTAQILTDARSESPPYYSVTSSDPRILSDNVVLFENTAPRILSLIKPMWCKVECTFTGVNDHGIKLVLREVVLEGPRGLAFP